MLSSLSVSAAAPGNRVFYGFNLGSAEWADGLAKQYDCGFVSYPFDLSETGTVLKSYLPTPSTGAYAGAGKDGIVYAALYDYTTATMQPIAGDLVAYNTYNGTEEHIGKWNPNQTNFKPQDMTYDAVSGKMYSLGYDNGSSGLYEVNLSTAEFTLVCELKGGGGTLAADAKGVLWTIGNDGILYKLNTNDEGKITGRVTRMFDTGLHNMSSNQTMEFDHTTGKLYWASNTMDHPFGYDNQYLEEIDVTDPDNITIREVGRIGIMSRLVAMYIPSAESLEAPAAPTNIRSEAGQGGTLQAKLTWVNPTEAFGGGEVGTLYGVVIKRNGEQVDYLKNPEAGKEMSWTDENVPEEGNYRYEIQAVNGRGNGAKGIAYQYVGFDRPAAVTDITGTVSSDMKSIVLKWTAPATGAQLGSYDPSKTKYTVTRNDGSVVAENLTECTVTDNNFRRLLSYSYTISAINDKGQSDAASASFILGPAVEIPMEQTFENEANVRNRWTIVDANNDAFTWMFGTNLGHSIFGDYEACAEYIVSPTLGNEKGADEWLISPPLALEAGQEYVAVLSGRAYTLNDDQQPITETVEVHCGNMNTVNAMGEKLGTINVGLNGVDESTQTAAFKSSAIDLPVLTEDATRCVGFHLVTPLVPTGFIQINSLKVCLKSEFDGVADVAIDGAKTSIALNGRTLTIFGEFNAATLYNMQGAAVATATSSTMNLEGLTSGVYVLSVDGQSFKIAL